jgi:hypothetical protein
MGTVKKDKNRHGDTSKIPPYPQKRATLIHPPYSYFSKETGGLKFVISKPPFCAVRSITTVLLCVSAQMLSKEKSR